MSAYTSYPFPVLGNGDDIVNAVADFSLQTTVGPQAITISVEPSPLTTGHPTIDDLVKCGKASWFLRLHCARTYFRREESLSIASPSIQVASDAIEGLVECELFIVALEDIDPYAPAGLNADYGAAAFRVMRGEVLAIINEFRFSIDPQFDASAVNAKSFLQIVVDESAGDGTFRVDCDGELILVSVSRAEWELAQAVDSVVPDLLHVCVAMPALAYAIEKMTAGDTRRWAILVQRIIDNQNLRNLEPLEKAQRILENPLRRGLERVDHAVVGTREG